MPLYKYRCEAGHTFERFLKLANYQDPQTCACHSPASRVISASMIAPGYEGYNCPITGDWIGSKTAHSENLKKHGCRVYEPGETDGARKAKAEADAQFDRALEDTVERTIDSMDSGKKERLTNELLGGADLAYERTTV